MMWRKAMVAVSLSLSPVAGTAQGTPPATLAERLAHVRMALHVGDEGLEGPGAQVLERAVRDARYVLIGEDHLTREIPVFTTDICRLMAPDGLGAMAVEVGPEAARFVDATLRRPDRLARVGAFMRTHPDGMAFQNGRDESDMAAACAKAAGPGFRLWGLDQEFFGAAGHLLERMLAAHPGAAARGAIERLLAADRAATAAALASGSPAQLLIYTVTDRQLDEARTAVAKDGGSRAKVLFAALEETRSIFLGQQTDGYASNGRRARLMKRTLLADLDSVPAGTRVLFKFGDAHMTKGVNAFGQRDLGNFVAERADGEGSRSLHLLVVGRQGTHALYNGVGRQVRHEPFVLTADADFGWLKDALPEGPAASSDWTLLDLRSLRAKPPRAMPAAWQRIVDGFDMIVVAPAITPSGLLGTQ